MEQRKLHNDLLYTPRIVWPVPIHN